MNILEERILLAKGCDALSPSVESKAVVVQSMVEDLLTGIGVGRVGYY